MISLRPSDVIAREVSVVTHSLRSGGQSQCEERFGDGQRSPSYDQLIGLAKTLSSARWRRKDFLSPELFGEPGWDMLLSLFHAEGKGQRSTVTDLCVASEAPQTTALRWIERLEQQDLVRREPSRTDGRITHISLMPAAHEAIEAYLRRIWTLLFESR